ncbi:RRS1-domain-containing protein [Ramicandelaber brevisporus]|nr:RRS1-domain-containing protein [Ramicandelaber brevisporus]KAI8869007.1 RRS1-domain-containing protein [Ramicandelaber brevisporus]
MQDVDTQQAVGAALEARQRKYKPTAVEGKILPVQYELALLAAFDPNPLNDDVLQNSKAKERAAYLKDIARDGTQLLINQIFSLPTHMEPLAAGDASSGGILAELPGLKMRLPREKPVPSDKAMTRWEKFAKIKGIQKTKRSRLVLDERTGEYKPRWGKDRANDDQHDWAIEVRGNVDPNEDMFALRRGEKKERIDKNKRRQRRNEEEASARSAGILKTTHAAKHSVSGGADPRALRKQALQKSLMLSKTSTASIGKFDKPLENDVKSKGVKRKFAPAVSSAGSEKETSLSILNKVVKGSGEVLNTRKAIAAVNREKRGKPSKRK